MQSGRGSIPTHHFKYSSRRYIRSRRDDGAEDHCQERSQPNKKRTPFYKWFYDNVWWTRCDS